MKSDEIVFMVSIKCGCKSNLRVNRQKNRVLMKDLGEGGRENGSGGGGEKGGLRVCDKELQVLLDGGYHYYYIFYFFLLRQPHF